MGVQELIKKSESYLALLSSNQSNSAQVNKLSDELLTLIKVRFLTNNSDTCAAQIEFFLYISRSNLFINDFKNCQKFMIFLLYFSCINYETSNSEVIVNMIFFYLRISIPMRKSVKSLKRLLLIWF